MAEAKSYRGVLQQIQNAPPDIQWYFGHLNSLIQDYPWDVSLGYMFQRVELAQRMTLYCMAVKLHRTNTALAWKAVASFYMTRDEFLGRFKVIAGKELPTAIIDELKIAQEIRDNVMHGLPCSNSDKRNAVASIIKFATDMNAFIDGIAGIKPFARLQGKLSGVRQLDMSTSRWVLKGMGFSLA